MWNFIVTILIFFNSSLRCSFRRDAVVAPIVARSPINPFMVESRVIKVDGYNPFLPKI